MNTGRAITPREAPDASTARSSPARFTDLPFQGAAGFRCGGMMPQAIAICRDSSWAQLCTRCEPDISAVASTCLQHLPLEVSSLYQHRLDTAHSRGNARMCRCARPASHLRILDRRDSWNHRRIELLSILQRDAARLCRRTSRQATSFHNAGDARSEALLHKSTDGQGSPFPGRTYGLASVTGMPSAVKPFRTATRTWNSAT